MIIGMSTGKEFHPLINVILLALASGLYIYFSCSEVISKEFHDGKNIIAKIICLLVATGIIIVLLYLPTSHGHGIGGEMSK